MNSFHIIILYPLESFHVFTDDENGKDVFLADLHNLIKYGIFRDDSLWHEMGDADRHGNCEEYEYCECYWPMGHLVILCEVRI